MADVVRMARDRRAELSTELAGLDEFIRVAEELIGEHERRHAAPKVDPFQARFNSGEVLPPLPAESEEAWPGRSAKAPFGRIGAGGR